MTRMHLSTKHRPLLIPLRAMVGGLMCILLSARPVVSQDDVTPEAIAAETTDEAPLQIDVQDIRLTNMTGLLSISGQFVVNVKVRNLTERPVELAMSQFALICDERERVCNSAVVSPLLASERLLKPGEELTGHVGANLRHPSGNEPDLALIWRHNGSVARVSLNEALRRVLNLRVRKVGPDNCLSIVTIDRSVDLLATWPITQAFEKLKAEGVNRVVLNIRSTPTDTTSYSNRMAIYSWLGSIKVGYEQRKFGFNQAVASKVQFSDFQVVGLGTQDPFAYRSTSSRNIYHKTIDEAIAFALRSLYDKTSLEDSIADMNHAELGVRRVAIESNIDRLTEPQLSQLLHNASEMSPEQQALIAGNLHRVAYAAGVRTLVEFTSSPEAEVATAAVDSLVKSVSPAAVVALRSIWKSSKTQPQLWHQIIRSVLDARDFRHTDLVEEYTESVIRESTHLSQPMSVKQNPPGPGRSKIASVTAGGIRLKDLLAFLQEQDESRIRSVAMNNLMNIERTDVQDDVVEFLIRSQSNANDQSLEAVLRNYVRQRLSATADGETSDGSAESPEQSNRLQIRIPGVFRKPGSRISSTLINVIKRYPDSRYTSMLCSISKVSGVSSSIKRSAYQVATQCATDEQLDEMIGEFHKLDRYSREHLLRQLNSVGHPQWLPLIRQCLRGDENSRRLGITALAQDGSVESLQLLASQLEAIVSVANSKEPSAEKRNPDLPNVKGQREFETLSASVTLARTEARMAETLINSLRTATFPDVRKILNRCERSKSSQLNEWVSNANIMAIRADPNSQILTEAYGLSRNEEYAKAAAKYDQLLKADPYSVYALTSRASLHLRMDEPARADELLERALMLSPENADIECLIALTEVRLGNLEKGIQMMLQTAKSIPNLATTLRRDALYNLACTYGRAIEREHDDARRSKLLRQGLAAMRSCVFRVGGFNDPDHVRKDPDLNVFRSQPEWKEIIDQIEANQKLKPGG